MILPNSGLSRLQSQRSNLNPRKNNLETLIYPYFSFNGCCREAMQFYQQCLGGELFFQSLGDSTGTTKTKLPAKMIDLILHSTLTKDKFRLMGSDVVNGERLLNGNSVSISIQSKNKVEIQKYFDSLSQEGRDIIPIKRTKWGTHFGSLTDKFDNHWLFTYNPKLKTNEKN